MSKISSLIPQQDNLHDFYAVRFAEYVTGKCFRGYILLAIASLGASLLIGALAFFVGVISAVFTFNETEIITITVNASEMFFKYFVGSFLVFFLLSTLHDWKDKFASRWAMNKDIVSTIIVCILMILLIIAWFLIPPFLTKDNTNVANAQLNCSEVNCDRPAVHSEQVIQLEDFDESIESSRNDDLDKYANLTAKEFDEIFGESRFRDVSAVATAERLTKGFEAITLFTDSKNTDWNMFLHELEEAINENPVLVESMTLNNQRRHPTKEDTHF